MVLILGQGIPAYNRFIRSTMHTTILKINKTTNALNLKNDKT